MLQHLHLRYGLLGQLYRVEDTYITNLKFQGFIPIYSGPRKKFLQTSLNCLPVQLPTKELNFDVL